MRPWIIVKMTRKLFFSGFWEIFSGQVLQEFFDECRDIFCDFIEYFHTFSITILTGFARINNLIWGYLLCSSIIDTANWSSIVHIDAGRYMGNMPVSKNEWISPWSTMNIIWPIYCYISMHSSLRIGRYTRQLQCVVWRIKIKMISSRII